VRFDLRPTCLRSGLHIATAPFAGGHMVRLSSLGPVSTPKDSDCYLTQHGRLGMNQVPVQEGGFARRAEVLCFLSRRAGPEKPMFHAHLSMVRWIRNRRSTCTTKITCLGSASMTTFPKRSAKVVRNNVKLRLNARDGIPARTVYSAGNRTPSPTAHAPSTRALDSKRSVFHCFLGRNWGLKNIM
jgi:hypothetical protein